MNRLSEVVTSILMRERPLQRFEKEVSEGGTFSFEVALKRGVEYTVRGRISKGKALAKVSLAESNGDMVPVHTENGGMYFFVTPKKDGLYQIKGVVEPIVKKKGVVVMNVALCEAIPAPRYASQFIHAAATPELKHRVTERATVIGTDVETAYGQTYAG